MDIIKSHVTSMKLDVPNLQVETGYDAYGNRIPDRIPLNEIENFEKSDVIVGEYSVSFYDFPYAESLGLELDSSSYIIMLDCEYYSPSKTKVILDGDKIAYPALRIVRMSEGFEQHSLNLNEVYENAFGQLKKDYIQTAIDKWNILEKDYHTLCVSHQDGNVSDEQKNKDNRNEIKDQLIKISQSISINLLGIIIEQYFNYRNSTVKDLSVIDGYNTLYWKNQTINDYLPSVRSWIIKNKIKSKIDF